MENHEKITLSELRNRLTEYRVLLNSLKEELNVARQELMEQELKYAEVGGMIKAIEEMLRQKHYNKFLELGNNEFKNAVRN